MRISDDERREVAKRLRNGGIARNSEDAYVLLLSRVGIRPQLPAANTYEDAMARLADLIEPDPERTCHFVYDKDEDEFKCDACGYFVTQSESQKEEYYVTQLTAECFVHCPFCGAMVVSGGSA